jgi:hypothetical protein
MDSLDELPKLKKIEMMFGMWNVRSLHRAGSLIIVAKEIDLAGVQGVRWDRGGTEPASKYTFFNGKANDNHELGTDFFFYIKRII